MFSDGTSYKLNETDMNKIQYHVKNCQARYKKTGDISEKKALGKRSHKETFPCSRVTSFGGKQKRKKNVDTRGSRNKQCITYSQIKYKV